MKTRNRVTKAVAAAALALGALSACGSSDGDSFKITYSSVLAEPVSMSTSFSWFASEVTKRSDGRIKFENHFNGSLLGADETVQALRDGRVDMAYVSPAYSAADFPLWNAAGVLYMTDNAEAAMRAWTTLSKDDDVLAGEFDKVGVIPLLFSPISANATGFVRPVKSVSDLAGLRIRALGSVAAALSEVKVDAVAISVAEVYDGLERGVLDGASSTLFEGYVSSNFQEPAPHIVDLSMGTYTSAGHFMSKSAWDRLPEDLQGVVSEVAEEYLDVAVDTLQEKEASACEAMTEDGRSVTKLTGTELDAWKDKAAAKVRGDWLASAQKAGLSKDAAADFLSTYEEALTDETARADYTNGMIACIESAS